MAVKEMKKIPVQPVSVGKGAFIQILIGAEEAPHFFMRRFIIEPKGHIPKHTNTVEHEQLVLRGKGRIGIGDEIFTVKKDDVLFIPANMPHWYENIGDEPFEFLCLIPNKEDKMQLLD
ncbi:cupin domain-containing protein [Caldithrix abyssi]|uniref:Cupin 2 conserved barrel domain protein n=1 Tax=Caldithrix abyssi DSM 13497 TaxID=880073 RepID=H1XPL9_CALAY|nr:cupin domain-containing protein [Caldithrix abyssi]APF19844.1 Cupin domain protein [Caldithrix abyssi DSM 13497]EHO39940.1 Cupin 2 conserved barrel domain protein [Caldithrix abyssi DSM 13497]